MVVDGEEEYEVEVIFRHKGKRAQFLYLVMWKGYPIIEASRDPTNIGPLAANAPMAS